MSDDIEPRNPNHCLVSQCRNDWTGWRLVAHEGSVAGAQPKVLAWRVYVCPEHMAVIDFQEEPDEQ